MVKWFCSISVNMTNIWKDEMGEFLQIHTLFWLGGGNTSFRLWMYLWLIISGRQKNIEQKKLCLKQVPLCWGSKFLKSPGTYQIPIEMFRVVRWSIRPQIYKLINSIWNMEELSVVRKDSFTVHVLFIRRVIERLQ